MIKPNLADWAESIIYSITRSKADPKMIKLIEAELTEIADKYYDIGLNHGWAVEQDKDISRNGWLPL